MGTMLEAEHANELEKILNDLHIGHVTIGDHLEEAGQLFPWLDQLFETLVVRSGILAHDDISVIQPMLKANEFKQLLNTEDGSMEKCILYYLLSVDQILAGKSSAAESILTEQESISTAGMRSKDLAAACRRLWKPQPQGTLCCVRIRCLKCVKAPSATTVLLHSLNFYLKFQGTR
jgi:hypothetical protein